MESIRTNNDFVGMTHILFEFMRTQYHIHQNCMRFIEIDYFHSVFSERDSRVG